jgi:pyrroloquinoline quinone biosynthesis protein D
MQPAESNDRPVLRPTVIFRVLDDLSGVAVDSESEQAHALNSVGVAVLERCDGTLTVGEIVVEVNDIFDAPREQIAADVHAFLADLAARGMIEW